DLKQSSCLGLAKPWDHRSTITMTSWDLKLLPKNACSLVTSSKDQTIEAYHRDHEAYGYFLPIHMRWQDNDQHGHVNNDVYCNYFDTIINLCLIRYCGLKTSLQSSSVLGFMVANWCTYHTPIAFPQIPVATLAVEKVGHSSVYYLLALFPPKPTEELPSVDHRHLGDGFFFGHPMLAQFDVLPTSLPEDFQRGLLQLMRPASV
uniref:Thioesterase domain-containing protein n=1 Tax=Piliocolobus tephrosceles TaxID=591936 RepID=A0A8C9LRV8_9PRIM